MHKRYQEWAQLTEAKSPTKAGNQPPLRIIDLPGFDRMERMMRLDPPRRGVFSPEVEGYADYLSKETFEITKSDTEFVYSDEFSTYPKGSWEWHSVESDKDEHDEQYETADATDDEAVEILLRYGLDFRDKDRGHPLLCTKLFCRQAEAAARGIMGKMPDRQEAGLQSWTEKLELEAKQFKSSRKR